MLVGLGVKKGSRILYLVPNIPESGQLWLASSKIGAISDFVDPRPDSMDLEANARKMLEVIKYEKANYIIALYGYKIKPYEIEKIIEENNKVKYCRIVQYYDDKQRGLMPIAHIVLNGNKLLDDKESIKLVEEIVYKQIIANINMSSRQIPSKFRIRGNMLLSKNGKISSPDLINEGLTGNEINVDIEETNLSVGNINIYKSKKLPFTPIGKVDYRSLEAEDSHIK